MNGTDAHFQLLGVDDADQDFTVQSDVIDDRFVKAVSRNPQGSGAYDAAKAGERHLGGATADIHDHGATGAVDPDAGSESGGDRFGDQRDLSGARFKYGVLHRPLFHLGHLIGNRYDHGGTAEKGNHVDLPEKNTQHFYGYVGRRSPRPAGGG